MLYDKNNKELLAFFGKVPISIKFKDASIIFIYSIIASFNKKTPKSGEIMEKWITKHSANLFKFSTEEIC